MADDLYNEAVKNFQQRLKEFREANKKKPSTKIKPPRYDDVFFHGVDWLDKQ